MARSRQVIRFMTEMPVDQEAEVQAWRFKWRKESRAAALRSLVSIALRATADMENDDPESEPENRYFSTI